MRRLVLIAFAGLSLFGLAGCFDKKEPAAEPSKTGQMNDGMGGGMGQMKQ
jgi:hypothetical protein